MKETLIRFNRNIYPREALLKAAYHFLDKYYVRVDVDGEDYVIEMLDKDSDEDSLVKLKFENELLAQTVRYQVYQQTHAIREILMARAMSSTLIGDASELNNEMLPENLDSLENILKDWFEINEN